jgi:FkbM family methyltransferase
MLPRVNLVKGEGADYLLLSTEDHISKTLYLYGLWDSHLHDVTRVFCQGVEAPLILDIGANLGAYAVPVAREIQASGGVVYCYEPQRIVYYQLCGNIFLNRLDNVEAIQQAIGDRDGTAEIPSMNFDRACNIGAFSMDEDVRKNTGHMNEFEPGSARQVPMRRLDSMTFPKPPTLIKLDVEGLELAVLTGGVAFLERNAFPPLLFEAWDVDWLGGNKTKVFELLNGLGYEINRIAGDDYVAQHPRNPIHIAFSDDAAGILYMSRSR